MQGILGPRWKVVNGVLPQITLWTIFSQKWWSWKINGNEQEECYESDF